VPPGAKAVRFEFRSPDYRRGMLITLAALLGVAVLLIAPRLRRRGTNA
jgi:hypothetical protein